MQPRGTAFQAVGASTGKMPVPPPFFNDPAPGERGRRTGPAPPSSGGGSSVSRLGILASCLVVGKIRDFVRKVESSSWPANRQGIPLQSTPTFDESKTLVRKSIPGVRSLGASHVGRCL